MKPLHRPRHGARPADVPAGGGGSGEERRCCGSCWATAITGASRPGLLAEAEAAALTNAAGELVSGPRRTGAPKDSKIWTLIYRCTRDGDIVLLRPLSEPWMPIAGVRCIYWGAGYMFVTRGGAAGAGAWQRAESDLP